jgi:selenocysteine-specific elongation factor
LESFIIIGTAGHVDHGKTQLVKALTGIDTDRLKEEKQRGISIELGFAPLHLSGGMTAGIVDVPGHERFVKTMLAGAGGIDLVLLVIAADEGVMPQTREHLDILELLHIQKGIVALTKTDLVDEEWLLLVEDEVRQLLQGTRLQAAPVIPVSVVSGRGLDELKAAIDLLAHQTEPKARSGEARLPVDRIFSKTGFGTVVTGTLVSGMIRTGDLLQLLPASKEVRVRSLQVHGQAVEQAYAGQRVAINTSGLEGGEITRGDVLATPGAFAPVRRLTVQMELLEHAGKALKNWQRVRFHLGTRESLGRVRLLDRDELAPGSLAPAQLELEEPVVAAVHDRFVIRLYSPVTAIGGGDVIESGGLRYRRHRSEVLSSLERKLAGSPYARAAEELRGAKTQLTPAELAAKAGIAEAELQEMLEQLLQEGEAVSFGGGAGLLVSGQLFSEWLLRCRQTVANYHRQFPLRPGLPKEELRTRQFSRLPPKLYQSMLEKWAAAGDLELTAQTVALPGFTVRLDGRRGQLLRELTVKMSAARFSPPSLEEIAGLLGGDQELLQYALQQQLLVKISSDLYLLPATLAQGWQLIRSYLEEHGEITVAEARDLLQTSRRYCLPLLEYFDRSGRTGRAGDKRVLLH